MRDSLRKYRGEKVSEVSEVVKDMSINDSGMIDANECSYMRKQ